MVNEKMGFLEKFRRLLGCKCYEKGKEISELKLDNVALQDAMKGDSEAIDEPKRLDIITGASLRKLLAPYAKSVHISDNVFGLTSQRKAKDFSVKTKVASNKWLSEKYDCDEFSFALMGYWNKGLSQFAFGIAWTNVHAFNIMVDDKEQIWIVEPQTNKFTRIELMKNHLSYKDIDVILI